VRKRQRKRRRIIDLGKKLFLKETIGWGSRVERRLYKKESFLRRRESPKAEKKKRKGRGAVVSSGKRTRLKKRQKTAEMRTVGGGGKWLEETSYTGKCQGVELVKGRSERGVGVGLLSSGKNP